MPIAFDQMRAKVSHYQDNGPLNALVHVLVNKMNDAPSDQPLGNRAALRAELCTAFHAEWDTYLSWDQLQQVLNHTPDPMHREMLLGPVLRRMLPEGDTGTGQVSVEAVSALGKRFGIRAESYKDYAGIKAEIKERLLKKYPDADEEALDHLTIREFKRTLGPEIQQKFIDEGHEVNLAIQKTVDELQRILAGETPHFLRTQTDALDSLAAENRLASDDPAHLATLSLLRVAEGYRFGMSNHNHDNFNVFDTTTHNQGHYTKGSECDYTEAAPVLRSQCREAFVRAVASQDADTINNALENDTSRIFSEYQATHAAKTTKTGPSARKGAGGIVEGVLGNISTFFGTNTESQGEDGIFGSMKGIMGLFQGLFGPFMQMIMGFQEALLEFNKKPGDPLSKKEMDAYTDPETRAAAKDFSMRAEALGERSTSAKLLNEQWRANPDATEVWVKLIERLAADEQLIEADDCLRNQEAKLLRALETLHADRVASRAADAQADNDNEAADAAIGCIQTLIDEYKNADGRVASLETRNLRANPESIVARVAVFKEVDATVQDLSKTHQALKDTANKRKKAQDEQTALTAQETAAAGAVPAGLAARLQQVKRQYDALEDRVTKLKTNENNALGAEFATPFAVLFERCAAVKEALDTQAAAGRPRPA